MPSATKQCPVNSKSRAASDLLVVSSTSAFPWRNGAGGMLTVEESCWGRTVEQEGWGCRAVLWFPQLGLFHSHWNLWFLCP